MSFSEFIHMGGYGAYVWSAYGIWLAVMVANIVIPIVRSRETLSRLSRRMQQMGDES